MVTELQVRKEEVELGDGRVLRVSRVKSLRDAGVTVVVELLAGAYAARSLAEPSSGSRLALRADAVPELRELLDEVTGDA